VHEEERFESDEVLAMEKKSVPPALDRVGHARAAAEHALSTRGWIGDLITCSEDACVFSFQPFPGGEQARELEGAVVAVTAIDRSRIRVQLGGVTVAQGPGWQVEGVDNRQAPPPT
jgi:hypothetical protein